MSIATLAEFQLAAGAGSDGDAADTAHLAAADAAVKKYLRWNPEQVTDEAMYLDGTGSAELVLPGIPVSLSVSEVKVDTQGGYGQVPDSFGTDTSLTEGTHFFTDASHGILRLWRTPSSGWWWYPGIQIGPSVYWGGLSSYGTRPAFWPRIPGCVKVTRTNGYSSAAMPADLKRAVTMLAAHLRRITKWGGWIPGSQSYIDASTSLVQIAAETLGNSTLPAIGSLRQLLAGYREPVIAGGIR